MIVRTSLRALVRRRARTLLALSGVAVSAALLLDMTMLASGLTESFGELTGAQGYALRVTPRGTLPFDSEAGIRQADATAARIAAVDGVRAVAPVLGAQLYAVTAEREAPDAERARREEPQALSAQREEPQALSAQREEPQALSAQREEPQALSAQREEPLFSVGVDPAAQMLYVLLEGGEPVAGEVVVSAPLAAAYGLAVGDGIRLSAELDVTLGRPRDLREMRVAGIGDFLYDYAGQRSLALPIGELRAMTGRADEVSLFAVAAAAGVDDGVLARRIEAALPELSVYSTADLMAAMDQRLLYFRQLATILGSIALVVTALLVATIVTIGVRERFGEIAALRAIGVARSRLLLGVVVEGLALAAVGCLLGLPLGLWMAGRLDGILLSFPGIPANLTFFALDVPRVALALGAVVLTGAAAGLLPGLHAVRAPLTRVLREEGE
jgi:putative ABC transport system permease protein